MIISEYAAYPSLLVAPICTQIMVPGESPTSSAPFSQATNYISLNAPGNTFYNQGFTLGPPAVVSLNGVIIYYALGVPVVLPNTYVVINYISYNIGNGIPIVGSGAVVLPVGAGSYISLIATGITSYNAPQ